MKAKRFLFRSAVWVSATLVLLSSAACNSIIAPAEINVTIDDNGKTQTVQKANYAFIGIPIEKGKNNIRLVYYPPYFKATLAVTVISLIIGIWYSRRRKKLGS